MERVADISRGTSAGRRIICTKWLIFEECDKLSSAGFTTLILWLNRYWQPTRQLKKKRIRGDWPRKRGLNQWKRQRRIAEEEAIRNMTEKERVLKAEKRVADEKRWAEAKRIAYVYSWQMRHEAKILSQPGETPKTQNYTCGCILWRMWQEVFCKEKFKKTR